MADSIQENGGTEVDRHLSLLSIFHYVVAGISGLFSLFPMFHVVMGYLMISGQFQEHSGEGPPEFMGWFFLGIGLTFVLAGLIYSVCLALSGWFLSNRRHYLFCLVMAGLSCIFFPFGTVLGVFTLIVLLKDEAKTQFNTSM